MQLLLAAAVLASLPPVLPDPKGAAGELVACGFPNVAVYADELLQEDVVMVLGVTTATDEQVGCAARVTMQTHVYIRLPDQLQQAYWEALGALEREASRHSALGELKRQGLLDKMPHYQPDRMSDREFAFQLEGFCGPAAKGALQSEYGPHSISPRWLSNLRNSEAIGKAFECLMLVAAANDFGLGFIGNEAASAEQAPV